MECGTYAVVRVRGPYGDRGAAFDGAATIVAFDRREFGVRECRTQQLFRIRGGRARMDNEPRTKRRKPIALAVGEFGCG